MLALKRVPICGRNVCLYQFLWLLHRKLLKHLTPCQINQLTVIDEYTRHKYMELAIVATVNWLIISELSLWVNKTMNMYGNMSRYNFKLNFYLILYICSNLNFSSISKYNIQFQLKITRDREKYMESFL